MKPHEKLKQIRTDKNITTYELSELTGIPQSTISKMENGKRKIETESLQKLAIALGVSVNNFFENKANSNTKKIEDDEFDDEIRAIARNMKNLSTDKRALLKTLIETMSNDADNQLKK